MPRQLCSVCEHCQRAAIDAELLERRLSYRDIASRYGVPVPALRCHNSGHIPYAAIPRGDNSISDGGPDVACLEDAIAREVLGPANWHRYVERWRREQRRARDR